MTRPVATEAKPWETLNTDGRPNLGSYEIGGALDVVKLAHHLTLTHLEGQPPIQPEVRYLAGVLLQAVDAVQCRVAGRVDRQASSHKHASRAVLAALDAVPVPWGADEDIRTDWYRTLVNRGAMLLETARDLIHTPDTDR
jgi:hypothetical protein